MVKRIMGKTKKLERILNSLGSDEARNIALSQLIGKVNVPDDIITKTIDDYEKDERFSMAAEVAKKAGLTDRAIDNYKKDGQFYKAAKVAKEAGLIAKSKELYIKVIDDYEKKGQFYKAAEVAKEARLTDRARNLKKLLLNFFH